MKRASFPSLPLSIPTTSIDYYYWELPLIISSIQRVGFSERNLWVPYTRPLCWITARPSNRSIYPSRSFRPWSLICCFHQVKIVFMVEFAVGCKGSSSLDVLGCFEWRRAECRGLRSSPPPRRRHLRESMRPKANVLILILPIIPLRILWFHEATRRHDRSSQIRATPLLPPY